MPGNHITIEPDETIGEGLHQLRARETTKPCAQCGEPHSLYRLSPYFCPDCDVKRVWRINGRLAYLQRPSE